MQRPLLLLTSLLMFTALLASAPAQSLPDGFVVEDLVSSGLFFPTDFALLEDGRAVIVEKASGDIKLWVPANGDQVTTIGHISGVDPAGERGLLSCTVDPDFATNGYIYFWVSRFGNPGLELLRYECSGDLQDAASDDLVVVAGTERVILNTVPDASSLHNGGTLRFGPDGMLYLSIGDDLESPRAQDSASLQGCILRLDVSNVPAGPGTTALVDLDPGDNPYSDSGLVEERLVIAFGFRNPFSFVIDPQDGSLFVGDVGNITRDELDHIQPDFQGQFPGDNFGWPHREGRVAGPGIPGRTSPGASFFREPIDDRLHFVEGFAIISAGIYRNQGGIYDWGPAYEGSVFHTDYLQGDIKRLIYDRTSLSWVSAPPVTGQPTGDRWATGLGGIVHFDLGADGALYGINFLAGRLSRIRPSTLTTTLTWVGGANQVGVHGGDFADDFVFELNDLNGLPVVGATINATTSPNAAVLGSSSQVTDANGRAAFSLTATAGGPISVVAETADSSSLDAVGQAYARGLEVYYTPGVNQDFLVADFLNVTFGTVPVPFIFFAAPITEPTTMTPFGEVAFDLLVLGDTVIIEDPAGFLLQGEIQGGYGTPGATNTYVLPIGFLSGTVKFQAIFVDFATPHSVAGIQSGAVAPTNIVTITF